MKGSVCWPRRDALSVNKNAVVTELEAWGVRLAQPLEVFVRSGPTGGGGGGDDPDGDAAGQNGWVTTDAGGDGDGGTQAGMPTVSASASEASIRVDLTGATLRILSPQHGNIPWPASRRRG